MTETANNLLQRIAADLNNAILGLAMLKGYLEGAAAGEAQQQNNATMQKSAIYFTRKEIKQMPTEFQKIITVELPLHVRQKPNGVYEARFRAHGYNIAVSSKDFAKLKPKFLAKLAEHPQPTTAEVKALPAPISETGAKFYDVADRWLELKKPTIKPNTYKFYVQLFGASILPAFELKEVAAIKQSDVQALINSYIVQDKMRTATKIYQTLKAIFEFAQGEEIIERSPMRMIKPPKYEEKNGCALALDEEREFVRLVYDSKCAPEIKQGLLFLLYTGIRRSELAGARIEGQFVSVICAKVRKGYREKWRLIPITPMLAPLLPSFDMRKLNAVRPDALTQAMKRLMPAHHLHELRHTFITRCQECSVAREVVSVWAGHAADNTMTSNVYTHFSSEFMLKEAQKVIYK